MKTLLTSLILIFALTPLSKASSAYPGVVEQALPSLPVDTRCSLSIGTPVIDYGSQSRWQLQDTTNSNEVTPGKRTLMLSVTCPYTQTMRLALHGDRSANGTLRYGAQGHVNIRLLEAQLDGQTVQVVTLTPGNSINDTPSDIIQLRPGDSFAAVRNGHLAKGKSFTARLEIEPVLTDSAARVSAHQTNESNLTLELLN